MKADIKTILLLIIGLTALGLSIFSMTQNKNKIGYVRSADMINKYTGMLEARNEYQQKSEVWQANMDTLKKDLERSLNAYKAEIAQLSQKEKEVKESNLRKLQENYYRFSQSIEQKAQEEDEKMTQAVLNQVNSFVEEYGKEQGYSVIIGTTASGNLLYGDQSLDITEEVLEALNEHYQGK